VKGGWWPMRGQRVCFARFPRRSHGHTKCAKAKVPKKRSPDQLGSEIPTARDDDQIGGQRLGELVSAVGRARLGAWLELASAAPRFSAECRGLGDPEWLRLVRMSADRSPMLRASGMSGYQFTSPTSTWVRHR
jgi:hypothetical protein